MNMNMNHAGEGNSKFTKICQTEMHRFCIPSFHLGNCSAVLEEKRQNQLICENFAADHMDEP
jgi:hypothetical protein